jgi:hypothetical protein
VEQGLRATIVAGLVPTARTGLGSMPGVDFDHTDTPCLCFVLEKRVQLSERPAMQASFSLSLLPLLFAASHLGGLSNVLEVLQDKGTASRGVLHKALGEDMVMVAASPKLFARKLFQVNADHFIGSTDLWSRQVNHHVQREMSLAITQVCTACLVPKAEVL